METPNEVRKKLEEALQMSRANSEHFDMMVKEQVKWFWRTYSLLKEQGFSETQALEIICRRGPFL